MNIIYLLIGTIILLMAVIVYFTVTHIRRQRNKKYTLLKVKKMGGVPMSKKELAFIGGYTYVPVKKFVDIKWRDWKSPAEMWDIIKYTINPFVKYRLKIEKLEDRIRSLNNSVDSTRRFVWRVEERVKDLEKKAKAKKPPVNDSKRIIRETIKKTKEAVEGTVQSKFDEREEKLEPAESQSCKLGENIKKALKESPSALDGMDKEKGNSFL